MSIKTASTFAASVFVEDVSGKSVNVNRAIDMAISPAISHQPPL